MIHTWLLLLVLVLADCAGTLLFTRGMKQVGEVSTLRPQALLKLASRAVANSSLRLGVFCMTIMFFLFITLLSSADVSFVVPATALTEPVNMLGTRYILQEHVPAVRWLSSVLICIGIYLISLNGV